jgi:hypothetical protein
LREIGIFIDNKDEPAVFCISGHVLEGCLESRICRLHLIGLIVPENCSAQSPETFGSAGLACLEESDIWLAGSKPAEKRRLSHVPAPIHDHHLKCLRRHRPLEARKAPGSAQRTRPSIPPDSFAQVHMTKVCLSKTRCARMHPSSTKKNRRHALCIMAKPFPQARQPAQR